MNPLAAGHWPRSTTDDDALDLSSCESEPIRTPGLIQPHGVLLALDPATFAIEQASENCAAFLGHSAHELIGRSPQVFLGERQYENLVALLHREALSGYTNIVVGPNSEPMECFYSRHNRLLLIELQSATGAHSINLVEASLNLEAPLARMRKAADVDSLVRVVAAEIRAISGFDRVMVYRFDEDWNGVVLAEDVSECFPVAYLGLHFPASDIPAQARELYLLNTLRLIPDIDYVPVPIRPAQSRRLAAPLDLSRSDLRSVSPIHIEYLRNIGVRATLTMSLVVHGRLWGLVACHHDSPRRLNHALRSTCNFFAQALALQLTASIDRNVLSERLDAGERILNFVTGLKPAQSLWEALLTDWERLLPIFGADAVFVRGPDGEAVYGSALAPEDLALVVERLAESARDGIASSSAIHTLDETAKRFAAQVSGALYIGLSATDGSCLVILRREQHLTVTWAGNPAKPAHANAEGDQHRLSPRASFEAWEEIVHHESRRWSANDLETGSGLRDQLMRRQETHQDIRQLANDPLTELPNRRFLDEMLGRLLRAADVRNDLVAVLFIDIDRFKRFNDRLGHAAGDRVLRHVAKRISRAVREGDIVGRLGGDEFVVIMPGLTERAAAQGLAERLLSEVAQPVPGVEGPDLRVTLSIGISIYPADAGSSEALLEAADSAMYEVKRNGRGAWLAFESARSSTTGRVSEQSAAEPSRGGGDAQTLSQHEIDDAIFELTRAELDALPFGVIALNRIGVVIRYNQAEGNLARTAAMSTIGKNFFTDIAPCTNVAAFRGRFDDFVKGRDSGVERFDFSFRFRWGRQDVSITMLRKAGHEDVNIVVRGHLLSSGDELALFGPPAAQQALGLAAGEAVNIDYHVSRLPPPTICQLGGVAESEMRARIHIDDAQTVGGIVAAAALLRKPYTIEYRRMRTDNSVAVVQESGFFRHDPTQPGDAVIVDVTERRRSEENNWRAAHYDYLTGLPNRETFLQRVGAGVAEAEKNARIAAVIVSNVDNFRNINDTFGYDIGSRLLLLLALRLGECVRGGDTVARLDGDRFAILLTDVDTGASVADAATRLLAAVSTPFVIDERPYQITVSCGISVAPYDSRDPNTLLRLSDTAMCASKAAGRNGFCWYSNEMSVNAANIARRHNELRAAIEGDELELHFQPIVDVAQDRIVAVESLVRWNHPTRGFLPPAEFIGLADSTGLIVPLGEWVLRAACRQASEWCAMGFDLRVCVNVSAVQFRQPAFVALVASILAENSLPPNRLELELTESVLIDGFGEIIERFGKLKTLGLRLSIDDFGTGYSSLSYLKYFPIDTLKIDRSFVTDVASDEFDRAIASTIMNLANELNFECIVEGIENAQQLEALRAIGCTIMQGYYFSRPTTPAKLLPLLGKSVLAARV